MWNVIFWLAASPNKPFSCFLSSVSPAALWLDSKQLCLCVLNILSTLQQDTIKAAIVTIVLLKMPCLYIYIFLQTPHSASSFPVRAELWNRIVWYISVMTEMWDQQKLLSVVCLDSVFSNMILFSRAKASFNSGKRNLLRADMASRAFSLKEKTK